jgi:hypothetical protein
MFEPDPDQQAEERELEDRRRLIEHLDYVIFPGCKWWFVDQMVEAIELAAAGEDDAWIEVDVKNRRLAEVIEDWELEEFVEEAKAGRFKPRGGDEMWRREPRREGEFTQPWRSG